MAFVNKMNMFGKNKEETEIEEEEYTFIEDYKEELPYLCRYVERILKTENEPTWEELEQLAKSYFNLKNKAMEVVKISEEYKTENEKLKQLLEQKESEINRYKEELQTATNEPKTENNNGLVSNYENKIKMLQNQINSYKAYIKETNQKDALKAFKKGQGGRKAIVIDWAKYDALRANGANQQQTADILKIGVSTLRKKLKERESVNKNS